jgi:hypothetical protein
MPFVQPDFNINVAFWRFGRPTSSLPDVVTIGNLSPGRLVTLDSPLFEMFIRLPKGTDVQDFKNSVGGDTCECPFTSGRFYTVQFVDDIGGGFTNEHRVAVLSGLPTWPVPFPPVGGFTPIVPPTPPLFLLNFTTAGVLLNTQTYGPFTSSSRIGGFIVVYNSAITPVFNTGAGAGSVVAGPTFTAHLNFGFGQTADLYSWSYIPVAGVNNLTVSTSQLGGAAWTGCIFDGFFLHGVTTSEGAAVGAGTPALGPYAPPSTSPWTHMSYVVQVVGASPVYLAPFANAAGGGSDTIALNVLKQSTGQFLAGIGGTFPAHCAPGAVGVWGMLQVGWAP